MKNLLLSSILSIAICGCTLGHYKKLQPLPLSAALPVFKPVFDDHFNSFLFKTNLSIYGKAFSGLLILKQMQPADYRVIFTTELGMKLFDFEFIDTAFTLHYCVPQFNRPALLRTIQQDMEILLMNRLSSQPSEPFIDKENKYVVFKLKQDNFSNYYFKEKTTQQLVKIEHAKRNIKKTTFTLENYAEEIPGHIQVQHHDIKLKIELTLLKK